MESIMPPESLQGLASRLSLYDSATRSQTPFVPLVPGEVSMYVCGATVQSSPHIGHMRAAVAFDVLRRWMEKLGYRVFFVRNVTDIDDKILAKAKEAGQKWWARAYHYECEFTSAYETLGVLPPTYEPRATGHMIDMIQLVQRLIDRGHAYVIENPDGTPSGNVYFDVSSWPEYGELTHQKTGTLPDDADEAAARKVAPSIDGAAAGKTDRYNPADEDAAGKRDPRDFALWKAAKPTEPDDANWPAPFGKGRPGWHLECSAMSHRYLGDDFDIHGGGLDLRFPHHENEMAQSRAAGWGFAHRWMHSAWVTQKGEKMSKSLGNGLSVGQVLANHSAWVARYALASVHYRSMLEWSADSLDEAEAASARVRNFLASAERFAGGQPSREEVVSFPAVELPAAFSAAMNDDVNVSGALAAVFGAIRDGNSLIADGRLSDAPAVARILLQTRAMLDVFGLDPLDPRWAGVESGSRGSAERDALDALVSRRLEARARARRDHDFATADAIRGELAGSGIAIKDGDTGSTWELK